MNCIFDVTSWNHCLIGHFADGKMPYALLCATARSAWKENAPLSIKQIGACFFFEFKDDATKLQVLDKVLKNASWSQVGRLPSSDFWLTNRRLS